MQFHFWYIYGLITIGLLLLGLFRFPNCIGRLVESCRDLGLSVAFAVCDTFEIEHAITPTVNTLPDYTFLNISNLFGKNGNTLPATTLPETWEVFKVKWVVYWQNFANIENFLRYLIAVLDFLLSLFSLVLLIMPVWLFLKNVILRSYFKEKPPQETDEIPYPIEKSKPLQRWRTFYFNVLLPVKNWFVSFGFFLRERNGLLLVWGVLACLYFNFATIFIEFIAYYLYFMVSMDITSLYVQIYKLFLDLGAITSFIPVCFWMVIVGVVADKLSKKIGYDNLEHNERRNRGFTNELGIVTYDYAEMGEGKTLHLVDMSLSLQVQLRDDALEIILECDACFPNFPWYALERALKQAYENHDIYDKWSCVRWIETRKQKFEENPCKENIFGYDIERYPMDYDNKLYVENIWETLQDYALAYTIYTVQHALIISNFSIRTDSIFMDLGNFPLWDNDFFHRDSRYLDAFSRHSNILDFDMLRLGKKMLKDNPNANAFGWGVYVITEADKEFKNTQELQEIKYTDEECNQKNDLTHVLMKVSRHACMIRHRNFVRIIADMQRVENITANMRQIGNVALITDTEEIGTVLPFFSPHTLLSPFLLWLKDKIDGVYLQNRYLRSDDRLLTAFLEKTRSLIQKWNTGYVNTFGTDIMNIELQRGRMDGKVYDKVYFKSYKKAYSRRYGSDCMASVFSARAQYNFVGLDDMREFADYIASQDELLYMNSHTQVEMQKLQEVEEVKKGTDIKAVEKQLSSAVEFFGQVQAGKVEVSSEASNATRVIIKELCSTLSEWVDGAEKGA